MQIFEWFECVRCGESVYEQSCGSQFTCRACHVAQSYQRDHERLKQEIFHYEQALKEIERVAFNRRTTLETVAAMARTAREEGAKYANRS